MRYLAIDELTSQEHNTVADYLKNCTTAGAIDGMYWISLPDDLVAGAQIGHQACAPFFFACELEEDRVTFELLVRCRNTLHCSCMAYATPGQRDYLLQFIDSLITHTGIRS